jgi:hypothetical protein
VFDEPRGDSLSAKRTVCLDPVGTIEDLLGIIVEAATGVVYEQQCAGTETDVRAAEGYYVPLGGFRMAPDGGRFEAMALRQPFHHRGGCRYGGSPHQLPPDTSNLPAERLDDLRMVIAAIPYWVRGDSTEADRRVPLQLDEGRIGELVEAWVPVVTPDGPAILVWQNCD